MNTAKIEPFLKIRQICITTKLIRYLLIWHRDSIGYLFITALTADKSVAYIQHIQRRSKTYDNIVFSLMTNVIQK